MWVNKELCISGSATIVEITALGNEQLAYFTRENLP